MNPPSEQLCLVFSTRTESKLFFWLYTKGWGQPVWFSGENMNDIRRRSSFKLSTLAQHTLLSLVTYAAENRPLTLDDFKTLYYEVTMDPPVGIRFADRLSNVCTDLNRFLEKHVPIMEWLKQVPQAQRPQEVSFISGKETHKRRFMDSLIGNGIEIAVVQSRSQFREVKNRLDGLGYALPSDWTHTFFIESTDSDSAPKKFAKCFITMDELISFEKQAIAVTVITSDFFRDDTLGFWKLREAIEANLERKIPYTFIYSQSAASKWERIREKYQHLEPEMSGYLVPPHNLIGLEIDHYTALFDCKDLVIYEFEGRKPLGFALNVPKEQDGPAALSFHYRFADSAVRKLLNQVIGVKKLGEWVAVLSHEAPTRHNTRSQSLIGTYLCFEYSHSYPGKIVKKTLEISSDGEGDLLKVKRYSLYNSMSLGLLTLKGETLTIKLVHPERTGAKQTMVFTAPPDHHFRFLVGIAGSLDFHKHPIARACVLVKLTPEEVNTLEQYLTPSVLDVKTLKEEYDPRIHALLFNVNRQFTVEDPDNPTDAPENPVLFIKQLSQLFSSYDEAHRDEKLIIRTS